MLGVAGTGMPRVARGDWQSKLLTVSQVAVGVAALLGVASMATRNPLLLLTFLTAQGLIVIGVVLFAIVAVTAQRTMVLERYGAGETIVLAGDSCRHIYVIKSGTVEVTSPPTPDGQQAVKRLGAGDHFGELALVGQTTHAVTVRAVTAAEVLKLTPGRFVALYTTLPGFREQREVDRRV